MEPPDDGRVGTFAETPVVSIDFNIPSTSRGKDRRNDSKGKSLKKQKERGNIVTKNIRNFFRGSTVAKLIDPLNSKEKKIIKITEESFFFF